MVEFDVLCAAGTLNQCIISYCRSNNLRVLSFEGKINIDEKYSKIFSYAHKVKVENLLNHNEELYVFAGKRARYFGFMLYDVRKIG